MASGSVCRPRELRRRMGVPRLCYRAAVVLCCCHSRTTCIARFHVRLETDGWHGNRRGRRGSRARVAAVLWHHSVECPAVTSSLRLRIACRTTEASLCSRASTVRSVLRYSLRRAGFAAQAHQAGFVADEPHECKKAPDLAALSSRRRAAQVLLHDAAPSLWTREDIEAPETK